jgi:alkanesulfonate monooxygenase SsuD/methylene tetrahydromethanopterin reductase-like flavin-dependent oxidoreductase (luciferase family)
MASPPHLHLAVALDGAGWHPAAWREPDARPSELFSPQYWVDLVSEAERGLLDFVTIDDSLSVQSTRRRELDERTDQVRGRLDAVLVAARVAPRTSAIGLVPVATTTHTEPFHVSKSIATLDYVSQGRAGWQARISATSFEARQFGRRQIDTGSGPGTPGDSGVVTDLFDEAADFIEVVRRL